MFKMNTNEKTTEIKNEDERLFEEWNSKQPEKYRIKTRSQFTRDLPEILILDRISKTIDTVDKNGTPSKEEMGICPIKARYPNGRESTLTIDIPTVIARKGFCTTISKTGKKTISIPLVFHRSNPDHKKFIDNMISIQNQAIKYIIDNPKTMKGGSKEPKVIGAKFSKLFYFSKDSDGNDLSMDESEEIYMYLNPLDYVDKEKNITNKMKIFFPLKKLDQQGKELGWEELEWSEILDKNCGLEITPKIMIQRIHHGAKFSFTVKCVSFVITNSFPIEKNVQQEQTLKSISENEENKHLILQKFNELKSLSKPNVDTSKNDSTFLTMAPQDLNQFKIIDQTLKNDLSKISNLSDEYNLLTNETIIKPPFFQQKEISSFEELKNSTNSNLDQNKFPFNFKNSDAPDFSCLNNDMI